MGSACWLARAGQLGFALLSGLHQLAWASLLSLARARINGFRRWVGSRRRLWVSCFIGLAVGRWVSRYTWLALGNLGFARDMARAAALGLRPLYGSRLFVIGGRHRDESPDATRLTEPCVFNLFPFLPHPRAAQSPRPPSSPLTSTRAKLLNSGNVIAASASPARRGASWDRGRDSGQRRWRRSPLRSRTAPVSSSLGSAYSSRGSIEPC